MKTKYSFEVHSYAPELNKIYLGSTNITDRFPSDMIKGLTKDYRLNIQRVRRFYQRICYNHFIDIQYISKSGYEKRRFGGFQRWEDAMPVVKELRGYFKTETPTREVKFLYGSLLKKN